MIQLPPVRRSARLAIFAALVGALALHASMALAGTLQIRDESALLAPMEQSQLRASALAYPFDVRVVTTSAMPSRAAFDQYVRAQVTAPNMVVVGIDPVHRVTSVHFGLGTRIAPAYYRAIEDAGDPFFRAGDWRGGIDAIMSRAATFVGTAPAYGPGSGYARSVRVRSVSAEPEAQHGSTAPLMVLGLLLLGGVVVAAIAVARRNRASMTSGASSGLYRDNAAPPFGPSYGSPGAYGPGYGSPQGPSPLGAGLIGAGLGGLAGYAIGRAVSEHEHHGHAGAHVDEHYTAVGPVTSADMAPSQGGYENYDAGGSTSGWDGGGWDGGSSEGGGWDSGSGGSDW